MNLRWFVPILACAAAAMTACHTAQGDWDRAHMINTMAAYQTFLLRHPDDKHADNARGRILALQDEHTWSQAQAANTLASYQSYLTTESGGVHVGEAKFQITALQRAADWKALPVDASAASLQAFLVKYPQGVESNEARARLEQLDYRIQLSGAKSEAAAERERARLTTRFAAVLPDIVVLPPSAPDTLYRVTSQPMSRATADSVCQKLARAHQNCKLVQSAGTPG